MPETSSAGAKKVVKGGRKGGTIFPRINLQQALAYTKKLVAKTHTGAQPENVVLPGVFGNAGPGGKVRASALKQFGLLDGSVKGYQATELAKAIDAAPPEDRSPLLQRSFRASKLFNQIFKTFHGDTVSKPKIEQRARGLDVHPDSAGECAQLFMDSAVTAGLGTMNGDAIALLKASSAVDPGAAEEHQGAKERSEADDVVSAEGAAEPLGAAARPVNGDQPGAVPRASKPGLTVSLNVDSSSDPDKLEKQLKLLRQYGVI